MSAKEKYQRAVYIANIMFTRLEKFENDYVHPWTKSCTFVFKLHLYIKQ